MSTIQKYVVKKYGGSLLHAHASNVYWDVKVHKQRLMKSFFAASDIRKVDIFPVWVLENFLTNA